MDVYLPTNKMPFRLVVTVKSQRPETIKIVAKDTKKVRTYYLNRKGEVNSKGRTFVLKFPLSPSTMKLSIYNYEKGNYPNDEDGSFKITEFKVEKLQTCDLWAKPLTLSFLRFAQDFATNASIMSAGSRAPHIYRSDDANFTIDYYDVIKNNGKPISTPARIGHNRGIIEVSRNAFLKYTVPMRMIILLHEYSHKWLNPSIGREISDEVAADINALNIYLSMGYPEMEAHQAFLTVFRKANNDGNHKRYLIINDFITRFSEGKVACNINKAA
jgi:hypothetical protein